MNILQLPTGSELPPLVKPPITQAQLRRYAEASGDYNPIHLDENAARRVGLEGVIAHGMLSMAFLGQFIDQQINEIPDAFQVQLKVRFVSMVQLGDTLTCYGRLLTSTIHNESSLHQTSRVAHLMIECWVQNQRDEKVTTGEALVAIPLID